MSGAGGAEAPTSDVNGAEAPAGGGARLARLGLVVALASRIFGRLVGIVLVVVLARSAGEETIAIYGYLLGTATLVLTLTDLGVASVAAREVAAGRASAGGALRSALPLQAVTVALAVGVLVAMTHGLGPDGTPGLAVALTACFVVAGGMTSLWSEILRGQGRVVLEGWLQTVAALGLVAVGVAIVVTGGDAVELLVAVLAKEVILVVVMLALVRPSRRPSVPWRLLAGQGLWVAVASTAMVVLWRQGMVVAGTGSTFALAVYVVASRYLDAGVTVAHTVGFGLLPGMSALATDAEASRRYARRYLAIAAGAGVGIGLVGSLAAPWLVTIPFGPQWIEAVPAVRWVAIGALPILVSFVLYPVLLARSQVRMLAVAGLAAVAVGVPVALALFAPASDPAGSMIGTVVGASVLSVILLWAVRDVLTPSRAVSVPR